MLQWLGERLEGYLLICMDLSSGLPKQASAMADSPGPCFFCTACMPWSGHQRRSVHSASSYMYSCKHSKLKWKPCEFRIELHKGQWTVTSRAASLCEKALPSSRRPLQFVKACDKTTAVHFTGQTLDANSGDQFCSFLRHRERTPSETLNTLFSVPQN